MTPSGIGQATYRFIGQHLNHFANAVPTQNYYKSPNCSISCAHTQHPFLLHFPVKTSNLIFSLPPAYVINSNEFQNPTPNQTSFLYKITIFFRIKVSPLSQNTQYALLFITQNPQTSGGHVRQITF